MTCRPGREALEARRLLSGTVRGVDIDGDVYTLSLQGPGVLRVINQPGPDDEFVPVGVPALIDAITVQGTIPSASRLVGAVEQVPGGDGRVFFENLIELPSTPPAEAVNVGLLAVDIPEFWLGDTSPGDEQALQGTIDIPDGVVTLRFGGVDTTAFFGDDDDTPLDENDRNDRFTVALGVPARVGTSVVVDRIITANEPARDEDDAPNQDTVAIDVDGRINLFQADAVVGDETLELEETGGRFQGDNPGGTTVTSQSTAPTGFGGGLTGAIGRFRIGRDATNLTVRVVGADDARLTNVSIGGETNKVSVIAPGGLRTALFGLGMDTVSIEADELQRLDANRGAVGSSVLVARDAGRLTFGADVIDTSVLAGYIPGTDGEPVAQSGGTITTLIAGDVIGSVFAASVQPLDGLFGPPADLVVPRGYINAKVEGRINNLMNEEVDPAAADQAFFASTVRLEAGPVVPPAAPSPPFRPKLGPGRTPGVKGISNRRNSPIFQFIARRTARRAAPPRTPGRVDS